MTAPAIYAVTVGGGILALCPLPGAGGSYARDLAHLRDWRPALVVTLADERELAEAGAADLGSDVRGCGARWVHLPLPDLSAPDADWEARWPDVSHRALAALRGGGRVLVQCRGGCGRSGMVVLRLMVEAGEAPGRALARLRAVRPCAVETEAQKLWAVSGPRAEVFRSSRGET